MSGNNEHVYYEKRQVVAGNPNADAPNANVSLNVDRPIDQPAGTIAPEVILTEVTRREYDIPHQDMNTHISDITITKTTLPNEEYLIDKQDNTTSNIYGQDNTTSNIYGQDKTKLEDVKDKTMENYNQGKEKLQDLTEQGKEKLVDVKDKTMESYDQGKEKLQDLTEKGKETLVDVKDKTMVNYNQGKEKLQNLTEQGKETLVDVKDKTVENYNLGKEKVQNLTEQAKETLVDVKDKTMVNYNQGKEKLQNLTEQGKEKLVDVKDKTMENYNLGKEKVQTLTEQAKETLVDVKDKTMENYNIGKEKVQTLTEQGKEKLVDVQDKTMENYNQAKEKLQDLTEKGKETFTDLKEKTKDTYNQGVEKIEEGKVKLEEQVNMCNLLKSARYCLEDFMNPTLAMEKQIPIRILSNAFGLLFLTEYKGSFGVGSSMGTGLIIARKANNQGWTGPCAIGMGGVSFGLQAGVQKIDHIIVLRDQNVLSTFISKGQLKLGGDISFAVGPLGRDAQVAVNVNDKDYAAIYSYSMSKGLHLGISLEGQLIVIRDDCNEDYYGKKVSAKDILFGNVDALSTDYVYSSLVRLIEEYTQKQGQLSQDLFTSTENRQDDQFWEKQAPIVTEFNIKHETIEKKPLLDTHANIRSENLYSKNEQNIFPQHEENIFPKREENIWPKREENIWPKHEEILNENILPKREEKSNLFFDSNKEHLRDVKKERINMDRLLQHARFNFEHFMNPDLAVEKQIPATLLSNACGLLFLTEIKGGIGIGGSTGIGFIITRNVNENTYSQPCVVGMGGISLGFQIGGQKTEHILIFRDEQILKTFINKGELNFGGDMSFAVGPLGRDVDVPINPIDKGYASIYSYSTSNGAYVGLTMERQMLKVLDDWNEDYFGKKVTANDILFGDVKPLSIGQHDVYDSLINLIKEYIRNKGILVTNNSYWGEIERKDEEYWKMDGITFEQKPLGTSLDQKPLGTSLDQKPLDTLNMESTDLNINDKEETGSMFRLLTHACHVFERFVSPNLTFEKRIPATILNGAAAIIFLTEIKVGLLVGGSLGRGFIIARRKDTDAWTGPCAITLGGMSIGWLAGAEKTDHVLVLRDSNVLQTFLSQGQLKFGGDVSFALGPLGRDASISVSVNDKGYSPLYSYSMSKGVYMGASLEGHYISIRDDVNEEYYGTKIKAIDILHGLVESPKDNDYKLLCDLLTKYITNVDNNNNDSYLNDTQVVREPDLTRVTTDMYKDEEVAYK